MGIIKLYHNRKADELDELVLMFAEFLHENLLQGDDGRLY